MTLEVGVRGGEDMKLGACAEQQHGRPCPPRGVKKSVASVTVSLLLMSVTDEPATRTASDCPPNTLIIVMRNRIIGPYHALGQSVH